MVRGKFVVKAIEKTEYGVTIVKLRAIYADDVAENKRFAKATPTASIEMQLDNPIALEFFNLKREFYVDFTPVEARHADLS